MKRTNLTRTAAALLALVFLFTHARADDQVRGVLARVRKALGCDAMQAWKRGLEVEGEGIAMGLETRFRLLFLPDGRFRRDIDSDLSTTEGFDGQRGWIVDFSGMPGHLESTELEVAKIRAWLLCGYWLDPGCPLEVTLDAPFLCLAITDGRIRARLEIDPESTLPKKLTVAASFSPRYLIA